MELISREKAIDMVNEHEYSCYVDCIEVDDVLADVPTVKAIPIEKLDQIKNRLEKMPFYFGTTFHGQTIKTVDVEKVIEMLDKAIKEQGE